MITFKQFLAETPKPSISDLVRQTVNDSGFNADGNCSGGRCYEFRDALYHNMVKHGYKPVKTSSGEWNRGHAEELGHEVGHAEYSNLEDNPHAWIYHKGKHYDALNPNGASRPSKMEFYKDTHVNHEPDEEEEYYQKTVHNKSYDKKKDKFV